MQWHMPMGYKIVDGKILILEEGKKIVEQIFKDYDSGESATHIGKKLKDLGIENAQGRVSWSHTAISRILDNQKYLGDEYYPQLIDSDLFSRVQQRREQVRAELKRGKHQTGIKERYLFSGVIICGECGAPHAYIKHGIPKWRCRNYVYRKQTPCTGTSIANEMILGICICAINQLIQNPTLIYQKEETESQKSKGYQELGIPIERAKENHVNDSMEALYKQASEKYQILKVEDRSYRTEEMLGLLKETNTVESFREDLYRKMIQQIIVCKDDFIKVIFRNGSSMKIDYVEDYRSGKGEKDGKYSIEKENICNPG